MTPRRILILLYVVLLGGLGLGAGALFLDSRAEHARLRQSEAVLRQRLAETQARLAEQERVLERLRTDRDYVSKVIRQRLHYAKPGEVVFRFED